ncbi:MAG: fibronectin type III domain-containing protein, partial [Terracidiphilus sp.]
TRNNSKVFESIGFCEVFRFGQAMAGLFRNVYMYVTNPVHIPVNIYSNQATWGTYVATMSETPAVATGPTAQSAVVAVQTNVVNESGATVNNVTLTTEIVDEQGNIVAEQAAPAVSVPVWTMPKGSQPLLPSVTDPSQLTAATLPTPTFSQSITVSNPTLWFPNNSPLGKPYMYRVYHILSVGGAVVDAVSSPLGIRTITWDTNFPYFNGVQMHLWGGASRYDYPALGSSVPDEIWWRDLAQFAAAGGNVWRPGHCSQSGEFLEAADAYGVMVDQPSGDGEGHWRDGSSAPSADDVTLKEEIHRDMVIYDRNHPSILDWETDNGGMNWPLAGVLKSIDGYWDSLVSANSPLVNPVAANRTSGLGAAYPVLAAPNVRYEGSRGYDSTTSPPSAYAYLDLCDGAGCETGQKHSYPENPAFGAEYWTNKGNGRGLNYDYELAFAGPVMNPWAQARAANTFGMSHWYYADTPGETCTWLEYDNFDYPPGTPVNMSNYVRSLGLSMVDQNRFPRLQYYVYQANWVPYSIKPVVHLAHHWNRSYQTNPIQENAFSNCPAVRLLINNKPAVDPVTGAVQPDQVPNDWEGYSGAAGKTDMTQSTTTLPGQVHWMVNWQSGSVTAECLDGVNGNSVAGVSDTRTTFGAESKIVLTALPEVIRPDGTSFAWTSNGSDAALVQAEVQDAAGNLVYTAADNVTFSINNRAAATYMGGTQQLVYDPAWGATYYQDAFSNARTTVIGGEPNAFFHAPGDPELNFEGGLQKIALRSTFTPGTVTVTATAPGLQSGSVTLTSVAPGTTVSCNADPAAPTGVTAVGGSDSTITVTWAAVTPPANCSITSYSIFRDGASTPLTTDLTSTTYTDTGLPASSTHTYTVEATDQNGASAQSSPPASGKTLAACSAVPPALTSLAGNPSSNSISLSWNAVSLPTGCTLQNYVVYSVSSSTPPVYTAVSPGSGSGAVTSTGYAVTGLTPLTNYTYAVTAVDEKGASAYSTPPLTVETTAVQSCTGLPNTPEAVLATANSSSQITVTWGTTTATGCTVYATVLRATASSGPYTQIATGIPAATTLQYVDTGLAPATTYYYEVESYDTVGTTDPSAYSSAETFPSSPEFVAIDCAGPGASNASGGDATFAADEYASGGGTTATTKSVNVTAAGANA